MLNTWLLGQLVIELLDQFYTASSTQLALHDQLYIVSSTQLALHD
jgi:hypothetical protein